MEVSLILVVIIFVVAILSYGIGFRRGLRDGRRRSDDLVILWWDNVVDYIKHKYGEDISIRPQGVSIRNYAEEPENDEEGDE